MRTKSLISVFVLLTFSLLFGCSSDEMELVELDGQDGVLSNKVTICVGLEETENKSRVAYEPVGNPVGLKATWAENDAFVVNGGDTESTACVFTIKEGEAGKSKAEFESSTEPNSANGYYVYYPSTIKTETQWQEFSYSGQKQVGDNNTDHLSGYATMRHYVPWYKDFNFTNETRDVQWTIDSTTYSSQIFGTNFYVSSCLHVAVSGLPNEIEPVELEISVAERIGSTALFYSDNQQCSSSNTLSMELGEISGVKSFDAYMMIAPHNVELPMGTILRIDIRDKDGKEYYCNKTLSKDVILTQGKTHTVTFSGEWEDYDPNYSSPANSTYDGVVTTLQTHTEGNGINVVFVGDGYSERQIINGTYKDVMEKGMEAFFSVQPFTYYREYFDVYMVNAVSTTERCSDDATQAYPNNTKFQTWFGDGTRVGGNDATCKEYAKKIEGITDENLKNTLIIVMMNSTKYAGTCWMQLQQSSDPNLNKDYGEGVAIAYFPIGTSDAALGRVLQHEANGHGFAKLDDEYFYVGNTLSDSDLQTEYNNMNTYHQFGWFQNVSITGNEEQVYWKDFINNSQYTSEGIGVYEGAHTYETGFWRPTENSIMNQNVGGFNAPSRKIIYYRINKLAYGDDEWEFNQSDFESLDVGWKSSGSGYSRSIGDFGQESDFIPLARPVVTVVDEFGNIIEQRK